MTSSDEGNFPDSGDRLVDVIDIASRAEQEFNQHSVAAAQTAAQQDQRPRADGTYEFEDCEDCGLEIGAERLRVAPRNLLCVHCATKRERIFR